MHQYFVVRLIYFFFCFLLLLAIFLHFLTSFHTTYIEIFEAGETGQCGLFHFYMGFLMYISSVFVSVSALLSSVICFGRKTLWSWRVYLEFRFPVHKKVTYSIKRGWVCPNPDTSRWQPCCPGRHTTAATGSNYRPTKANFELLHPTTPSICIV